MKNLLLLLATTLALCSSVGATAQSQEKPRVLGLLGYADPVSAKAYLEVMSKELADLGWIEGRNLTTKYLYARGELGRIDGLAKELVALKPDVIYTTNAAGVLALQRLTTKIPIVFSGIGDPVGLGLVKSLREPGGNTTGLAGMAGLEVVGKRIQLLKELYPRLSRLAVMADWDDKDTKAALPYYHRYGSQFGVQIIEINVQKPSDLDGAFAGLTRERPDVLYVFNTGIGYPYRDAIASRAIAARIPTMCGNTKMVEAGLLASYGMRDEDFGRLGARYVDRILRGANPATLPVERPSKWELVINAKTAREIGVQTPQSILLRADRVIE